MTRRHGNFQNFLQLAEIRDFSEVKHSPAFRQRPKSDEEYAYELHSRIFELRKQNFILKRRAIQRGLLSSSEERSAEVTSEQAPKLNISESIPAHDPQKCISLKALGHLAGAATRLGPDPELLPAAEAPNSSTSSAYKDPLSTLPDDSNADILDDSSIASSLSTSGLLPQNSKTGVADELSDLTKHVDNLIEDAKKTLTRNPQDVVAASDNKEKSPRGDHRARRKDVRDKIDSMLKAQYFGIAKQPLWRHKLAGNDSPEPHTVLKGAALLRSVARMVLYSYAKPLVAVRNRKLMAREKERTELSRTIQLFVSSCSSWMGKAVKLPVQSTQQDHTLNFHPDNPHRVSATPQQRIMQLKVRMQSIVRGLVALEMPPPHITSFLSSLIADDNYFSSNFLFSFEHAQLDFNTLGGTRNVLQEVTPASDAPEALRYKHSNGKTYNIRRSLTLIKGFLILKVLIYTMLLAPWSCGLCGRPVKKKRLIVDNMRCLASCVYWMLRVTDSMIPAIPHSRKKGRMWMNRPADTTFSPKSWFQSRATTDGDALPAPESSKNVEESDVNNQMLAVDRPLFVPIEALHKLLVADDVFRHVSESASIWINEFSDVLEEWIMRITKHVIDYRIELDTVSANAAEKNA